MKSFTKQLLVGALLALTLGTAGAATKKLPPQIPDPCTINYLRCIKSFAQPICAQKEQACRNAGLGTIGANATTPEQALKALSPDADFHAMQFQTLVAAATPTPAMCRQWLKQCNNGRGDLRKCALFDAQCVSP